MEQPRNKQPHPKKRPDILQNPQLTTAQLTLNRTAPVKPPQPPQTSPSIDPSQVLQQAQQLWQQNDSIQSINLIKGLIEYLKSTKYANNQVLSVIHTNLAICYYKIGFLEEALEEFVAACLLIKDQVKVYGKAGVSVENKMLRIRYNMLLARIQLQTCILYSQMGKHNQALKQAQTCCKQSYNMIYDIQLLQYQHLSQMVSRQKLGKQNKVSPQNLVNNITIVEQLIKNTKDLCRQFICDQKYMALKQEREALVQVREHLKIGDLQDKTNIQMLYNPSTITIQQKNDIDNTWIYKNKILDEIQMKFVTIKSFDCTNFWKNNEVIEKIVYLIISLYCYSTQTRFLQKSKLSEDPSEVLDSEHWLSRSLEIAYTFLPHQAPILNQILTVHDRFHGIDKQTIPEDKQIRGFFKVLRPLSKPKSNYTNKNTMCSPIMIRIQVPKLSVQLHQQDTTAHSKTNTHINANSTANNKSSESGSKMTVKNIDFINKTIDLQSITRNNKIRGLNINTNLNPSLNLNLNISQNTNSNSNSGSKHNKKYELSQVSQSTIKYKNNTKIDFTQNLKNIYACRKIKSVAEHNKAERMKINITGAFNEENIDGIKSMRRPHSYDKQIDKHEEIQVLTERQKKKKSVSLSKRDSKKRSITSNSTGLKLDGLQMLPNSYAYSQGQPYQYSYKKVQQDEDTFELNSLQESIHENGLQQNLNQNRNRNEGINLNVHVGNGGDAKMGGNIFINNNINLFISKESLEDNGLTKNKYQKYNKFGNAEREREREKEKQERGTYEISKRQNFKNKRRAHHSNFTGTKNNPQFII